MPTNDKQIFNGAKKPNTKKYEFICWMTGTKEIDGVKFTAFSEYVARKSFANAFNLSIDEVRAKKLGVAE